MFDDENKENPTTRRCCVIRVNDDDNSVVVLGISGSFYEDLKYVELPWRSDGHPLTTLNKPSAANIEWVDIVSVDRCERVGTVPGRLMFVILERLNGKKKT
jgi:hypothetical protein